MPNRNLRGDQYYLDIITIFPLNKCQVLGFYGIISFDELVNFLWFLSNNLNRCNQICLDTLYHIFNLSSCAFLHQSV